MDPDDLFNEITNQTVEIVLTAHPTQVNRRTLQYKHAKIAALLQQHDRQDLTPEERDSVIQVLLVPWMWWCSGYNGALVIVAVGSAINWACLEMPRFEVGALRIAAA